MVLHTLQIPLDMLLHVTSTWGYVQATDLPVSDSDIVDKTFGDRRVLNAGAIRPVSREKSCWHHFSVKILLVSLLVSLIQGVKSAISASFIKKSSIRSLREKTDLLKLGDRNLGLAGRARPSLSLRLRSYLVRRRSTADWCFKSSCFSCIPTNARKGISWLAF